MPSKRSYLCSKHFTEDCFDRSEFYAKLNRGAVPTIFNSHQQHLETEVTQQSTQEPETPSADESLPPPPKKIKKNPKNTAEEMLGLAAEYFNTPESESEVVAKGWAMKLNRLSPDQRLFAEKIINDTLFEAQLGNLTRNGVRFLAGSQFNSH
ncbi:unnamed protein product [Nezara viridula]|uniref:THAP-type domain-containing protein n=2 Tax=Nezara viridula TaxID=85310 RepID=A0A9P0H6G6_NEZVI|nr:unnamed protein product [Nezara viridula]